MQHACDPGVKLNNHFNVDKLPFMNKKNKCKISSVVGLMNNINKKVIKLDSPFNENDKIVSINEHPVSFQINCEDNKVESGKKKETKKERSADLKLIKEDKQEFIVKGILKFI